MAFREPTAERAVHEIRVDEQAKLRYLKEIERKVLWLSSWMIHNANHLRSKRDGLKVGGHQASCASVVTLMTALYFDNLRPQDRVAVKPHASPVFHAIQYLFGRQTRERLERFRGFGGAQSYPSRTKDADDVDFSTGSVGLGVAMTLFAAYVQDYVRIKGWAPGERATGRMVALVGDAELDEGNVYEALLEGWKHDVRNVWWVIDYNRQSLDSVVEDRLLHRFDTLFTSMGWNVVTLKYGKEQLRAFQRPGGEALRAWIDACPNSLYSALVYKGAAGWREALERDFHRDKAVRALIDGFNDDELQRLMTNLGGHDMETILEAFNAVEDDTPTCFIAYTVKGFGLPFAGHKDNHAGLMNPEQMATYRRSQKVLEGAEWEPFAGLDTPEGELREFVSSVPFAAPGERRFTTPPIAVPETLSVPPAEIASTQEGFGRLLNEIAKRKDELADRIVTTSPDVTVSTNLGGWVNRQGIFHRQPRADVFHEEHVLSAQKWAMSPEGQHVELGIAENNLFVLLAAFGLSGSLFGARVLPIGTLYDPFIGRGLDALNYACYQDARFLLVATPSGLSLAPEGGAHQSVLTPLVGTGQSGLTSFEPAFVDELAEIMRWSFEHMQDDAEGGSVYLRLSTRPLSQPERELTPQLRQSIVNGGYWEERPSREAEVAIVCTGVVSPEARAAFEQIREDVPGAGLLQVTSSDRLHRGWREAQAARGQADRRGRAHVEELLAALPTSAALVTIVDGHPAALSWLGSVGGHRVVSLGVEEFGQSGDVPDLYRAYGIDTDAIVDAVARALIDEGM
ncbi:MAG: transketolase [Planctomycetes bacterium]|nr:transketolase [Planctomycetota bacterium]